MIILLMLDISYGYNIAYHAILMLLHVYQTIFISGEGHPVDNILWP